MRTNILTILMALFISSSAFSQEIFETFKYRDAINKETKIEYRYNECSAILLDESKGEILFSTGTVEGYYRFKIVKIFREENKIMFQTKNAESGEEVDFIIVRGGVIFDPIEGEEVYFITNY